MLHSLWYISFVYFWCLLTDYFYVQPSRELRALRAGRNYEPGAFSFSLRAGFVLVLSITILRTFVVDVYHIPTPSMVPTYQPGESVIINRLAYGFHAPFSGRLIFSGDRPRRGDVVVFRYPNEPDTSYIKRLVGLPGDHLVFENSGRLYVNDILAVDTSDKPSLLRLPDASDLAIPLIPDSEQPSFTTESFIVPLGHYYVLGQNLGESRDSREWGYISEAHLIGRPFR